MLNQDQQRQRKRQQKAQREQFVNNVIKFPEEYHAPAVLRAAEGEQLCVWVKRVLWHRTRTKRTIITFHTAWCGHSSSTDYNTMDMQLSMLVTINNRHQQRLLAMYNDIIP